MWSSNSCKKRYPANFYFGWCWHCVRWSSGARVMNFPKVILFKVSIARSLGRSVARSLGRSIARSLDRSVARSLGRSVARSIARTLGRSVAGSLGRSVARSLSRSIARSIGRSIARSIARSLARSLDRSLELISEVRFSDYGYAEELFTRFDVRLKLLRN